MCYWCGYLNYFNKDYECWIQSNGNLRQEDQEYGPWLRASLLPMHKQLVIVVPRYYETKRKELEAVDIKKDKYDPKAMAVVVCGGSHGGGVKEFLFQNTTLNEKLL